MSFIVTGGGIPANCFRCPLDKGVWKQEQDPFILCRYTKEIVRYDDVPTDRKLPCCGLKEMPEKHGRLIDAAALIATVDDRYSFGEIGRRERDDIVDALHYNAPTIVEAEGD